MLPVFFSILLKTPSKAIPIDIFAIAYIDDVLVYSTLLSEHKKHVKLELAQIKFAGLRLDLTNSEFHVQEVTFLGLLVGKDGIRMDPKKIEGVQDWAVLQSVKDIQFFIGFVNFYCHFIKDFYKVAHQMMELTQKNASFL